MARSCKKVPIVKDHSIGMKTIANRKVRRRLKMVSFNLANGNAYRKLVCSYDISDWAFRETYGEYCARAEQYRKAYLNGAEYFVIYKDLCEGMLYWQWFKMYKRK